MNDDCPRTDDRPCANAKSWDDMRTRSELNARLQAHLTGEMSTRVQGHEVLQDVVMRDPTMYVDGDEASEAGVGGQDRAGAYVAPLTDHDPRADDGCGMDHARPRESERQEPLHDLRFRARQPETEH